MPLVPLVVAWLVGIVIADALRLPMSAWIVVGGLGSALAWLWPGLARRAALLVVALALGGVRLMAAQPDPQAAHVWDYNSRKVTLIGEVVEQPDRRENKQSAVIAVSALALGREVRTVEGRVLLQLPAVPELRYGQRVRVLGTLDTPPDAGLFDYRAYLARHGIRSLMKEPRLTVLPGLGGAPLLRPLLYLNDAARTTALRLLPEPHASLLVGILLGVQSTIPPDVLADFSTTGTSHILVISGWNITVVVAGVVALFGALGWARRRGAWAALALLVAYVLFVGASPAVLRAALMGALVVWAELAGRSTHVWTLLLAACGAMTLLDPNVAWDIGFQLSALATAGLFAWARPLQAQLARGPLAWRGLAWAVEPLTATLAASVFSLPILLYHFGQLSLVAPIANVLMLPLVPWAMLWGALATTAGLLWLPLGQGMALGSWPFLQWLLTASHTLARLPGAATTFPPFHAAWVWGYYLVIGAWWLRPDRWLRSAMQRTTSPTVAGTRDEAELLN